MKALTQKSRDQIAAIKSAILENLTDDLRYERFRRQHPMSGFCYVSAEVGYHMFGKKLGFKPMFVKVDGIPHWFLERPGVGASRRIVFDPCGGQFANHPLGSLASYPDAKGKGFLTKSPSKRAQVLMKRVRQYMRERE